MKEIVTPPNLFANSEAFIKFFELPLADIASKISPVTNLPRICSTKISSKEVSFPTAVISGTLSVNEITLGLNLVK